MSDGDARAEEADREVGEVVGSPMRASFLRFLDAAKGSLDDKLERLRAPSPGEEARPRGGSVVVLEDPRTHARHGSDEAAQQDVIRLLKQCVAASSAAEEELRAQLAAMEKEVHYWKRESYSGISVTLEAISQSPQYRDLKDKLRLETARADQLQLQLDAARRDLVQLQERQTSADVQLAQAAEQLASQQASLELAHQQQMAALTLQLAQEEREKSSLQESLDAARRQLQNAQNDSAAQAAAAVQLQKEKEELAVQVSDLSGKVTALGQQLKARDKRAEPGSEELQILQRDRAALAKELAEAKRRIVELEKGRQPVGLVSHSTSSNDNSNPNNNNNSSNSKISGGGDAHDTDDTDDNDSQPKELPAAVSAEDAALQERFRLNPGECILAKHGASSSGQHGHAWLTRVHLCFGGSAVSSFFDRRDVRVPLEQIRSVAVTGNGKLELLDEKGQSIILLSGIRERDKLTREILGAMQAALPGRQAPSITRDGVVVPDGSFGGADDEGDDFVLV